MRRFALIGHRKYGDEIISILKNLGGINVDNYFGWDLDTSYWIDSDGNIKVNEIDDKKFINYTFEEYKEIYKYNIGDKIIYKGLIHEIIKLFFDKNNGSLNYVIKRNNENIFDNVDVFKLQPLNNDI